MQFKNANKKSISNRIINIAIIAVSIGITIIIIAISTGKGLQEKIKSKTVAFNGHISVMPFENNESQISVLPFEDDLNLRKIIKKNNAVNIINSVAFDGVILKKENDFEGGIFKGVDSNYNWKVIKEFLIEGNYPEINKKSISKEIILSKIMAKRLSLELGDNVDLYFQNSKNQKIPYKSRFKIVGLFNSGFPDIDNNLIYGDIDQIRRVNKWEKNKTGSYEIFIDNIYNSDKISKKIYNDLPSNLDSISISKKYKSTFQWIALFDFNILIILIIVIIVSVVNLSTAILILIFERSKMISLLKTMGLKNNKIKKIFLWSGLLIISRGLLIGNFFGLLFFFIQKKYALIKLDPETYFVEVAPVIISLSEILFTNILFIIVCTFLLWIPLNIILKISPSKSLRFR
ncbi:MAG: transmembrane permease [Flavobacteriaceae bacterium]|nr:transmembrane permease [Flavobacteriaceae bacterium]|tara:strand:- start:22911 stop:24119 length:1209 start_codon:yes stop_codon:yes gene_type:complete